MTLKLDFTKIALIIVLVLLFFLAGFVIKQQISLAKQQGRTEAYEEIINNKDKRLLKKTTKNNKDVEQNFAYETDLKGSIDTKDDLDIDEEEQKLIKNIKQNADQAINDNQFDENDIDNKEKELIKNINEPNLSATNSSEIKSKKNINLANKIRNLPAIGRIKEVNNRFNFIVIDIGINERMKKGTMYAVKRYDEIICLVQIALVEENESIANIIPESKIQKKIPKKGDYIIYPPPY